VASSATKLEQLRKFGALRRASPAPDGCRSLDHFHEGYYECDFVSPWTLSAQNVDAKLAIVLQDWCGSKYLEKPVRPQVRILGHDPKLPTNKNLKLMLSEAGLRLEDTFGTNAFPWIKQGAMSASLEGGALNWAFGNLVLPQIEIVRPKVVVMLGKTVHKAACQTFGVPPEKTLLEAIENPFQVDGIQYFTVAHTGSKIRIHRGWIQSIGDWRRIRMALGD
jgi:hypothetical protein